MSAVLTREAHVGDDGVLAVLDAADVLEESVDGEQDDEPAERHHADHCSEAARVAVAVVATSVLVPALVWDAPEHDHREQLHHIERHSTTKQSTGPLKNGDV